MFQKVPGRSREKKTPDALALTFIENVNGEDLSPVGAVALTLRGDICKTDNLAPQRSRLQACSQRAGLL